MHQSHPGIMSRLRRAEGHLRTVIATKEQSELKTLQNKITNLKGRITKDRNNLQQARKNWVSLFPIEDDPQYQKALQIIQSKEDRLKALEFQMQTQSE